MIGSAEILIEGVLESPIMGQAITKGFIRITAIELKNYSLTGSVGVIKCGKDGSYSFNLNAGVFTIEVMYTDEYILVGTVNVEQGASFSGTLASFISGFDNVDD